MTKAVRRLRALELGRVRTACLAMRFYDGLTQWQIGAALGISQQAVAAHVAEGLEALRQADLRIGPIGPLTQPRMILETPLWMDQLTPEEVKGGL